MRACVSVCWMAVNIFAADAYKAAVVSSNTNVGDVLPAIYEAGRKNVDILVLSSKITKTYDSYDDTVRTLSKAAKQAGLYLVAHLNEPISRQNIQEHVRSNVVFDRQGSITNVYRKPITNTSNVTISTGSTLFGTDFGVNFGLMMEEDLVLKSPEKLNNFVVIGSWPSELPFLSAPQFASTWAYTTNANVLSDSGIFSGKSGAENSAGSLIIADLNNNDGKESSVPVMDIKHSRFSNEDFSQYMMRPLNMELSSRGYKDSVCHNSFCCEFYVKTTAKGVKSEMKYGLAVFDGISHYGGNQFIGVQNCAILLCADHEDNCHMRSTQNTTDIIFEEVIVSANFTSDISIQYPVIISNNALENSKFNVKSGENIKEVSLELVNGENIFAFGIFGRDFEADYKKEFNTVNSTGVLYDYILTDEVLGVFDYLWIRVRILLFIVSIYVLEMM